MAIDTSAYATESEFFERAQRLCLETRYLVGGPDHIAVNIRRYMETVSGHNMRMPDGFLVDEALDAVTRLVGEIDELCTAAADLRDACIPLREGRVLTADEKMELVAREIALRGALTACRNDTEFLRPWTASLAHETQVQYLGNASEEVKESLIDTAKLAATEADFYVSDFFKIYHSGNDLCDAIDEVYGVPA